MEEIPTYDFVLPTRVRFGVGVAREVGSEAASLVEGPILLVSDSGVVAAGLVDGIRASLQDAGVAYVAFTRVAASPTPDTVSEAAALAVDGRCGAVVAVGGGSVLDVGKSAAVVAVEGKGIASYEGWNRVRAEPLPVIAIPTTAGTGSEVTAWAVISEPYSRRKMPIGSPRMAPRLALVDPELTYSLPAHLTAYTGMDALATAVEAYTGRRCNPVADALALAAVERIAGCLRAVVNDGSDRGARASMHMASTLAGMAFSNSDVAGVHCLAEAIEAYAGLHHGFCCALVLDEVMAFNAAAVPSRHGRLAALLGATDAALAVRQLAAALHIPSLREVGIVERDLPRLAAGAARNISASSNPRPLTEEALIQILRQAFD